jgi:hypothetical protein
VAALVVLLREAEIGRLLSVRFISAGRGVGCPAVKDPSYRIDFPEGRGILRELVHWSGEFR